MRPVPSLMGLGRAISNLTPKVYTRRQLEGGKPYRLVPISFTANHPERKLHPKHLTEVLRELLRQAYRPPFVPLELRRFLCELSGF
jgi:hypothetical protein